MYFETVLSYLATYINDISLMNFSNHLTDLLVYVAICFLCFPQVLSSWAGFESRLFQSFCFVTKLRLATPVFVGTAKVEIFLILSSFYLNFFTLFYLVIKPSKQPLTHLYCNLSNSSLCISHTNPSSEAGCKSKKIKRPHKLYYPYNWTTSITVWITALKSKKRIIAGG